MNCSHYAPPTWVSSSTICKISAESPSPDSPKINKITRSSVSLLFNISGGLRKKMTESDFLDIFLQDGIARYDAAGLTETHDIHDSFDFPGYKVFAEPRRHGGRKRKGGVALLLSLEFSQISNPTRLLEGVPPETVAVVLKGSLFNSSNDVVMVVSYITRLSWKSHKKYQSSLGTSLYSLMKLFLIKLRNSGYSVL